MFGDGPDSVSIGEDAGTRLLVPVILFFFFF